jgi:hypothetical protein
VTASNRWVKSSLTPTASDTFPSAVVATNTVLGSARAWARGGSLSTTAGGDVRLQSTNDALVNATVDSSVAATTSVGVTLAFNTIGYRPDSVWNFIRDAFSGGDYTTEQTLLTEAWADGTRIDAAGSVLANASSTGHIQADIANSVCDKCFFRGSCVGWLLIPETY